MSSLTLGSVTELHAGTRVDNSGLLHNETITLKLEHIATRVGKSDLVDFIGVHPDLALSALEDIGREALLEFERDCKYSKMRHEVELDICWSGTKCTRDTNDTARDSIASKRCIHINSPILTKTHGTTVSFSVSASRGPRRCRSSKASVSLTQNLLRPIVLLENVLKNRIHRNDSSIVYTVLYCLYRCLYSKESANK